MLIVNGIMEQCMYKILIYFEYDLSLPCIDILVIYQAAKADNWATVLKSVLTMVLTMNSGGPPWSTSGT